MEISKNDEDKKLNKDKFFVKISFLIFGIGDLLPWNAILSQLDFFSLYLKKSFRYPLLHSEVKNVSTIVQVFDKANKNVIGKVIIYLNNNKIGEEKVYLKNKKRR